MNRKDYRAAVDAVRFSEDFEQNTIRRLRQAAGQPEKESQFMKVKRTRKLAVVAAALTAVLVVSAAAVTLLLRPADVAGHLSDPTLAAAFESEGAVSVNQSVEAGDYRFTLAGLVSGKGLSDFTQDVDAERTYVVASMARLDGTPMGEEAYDMTFTPLVSGYKPWQVNIWTLGGGRATFLQDGVAYYLFDCDSLEIFADHTVYLAAYEGVAVPSAEMFSVADDGAISFTEGCEVPHALFTLPLDASKADPAAAEQFLADCGIAARD